MDVRINSVSPAKKGKNYLGFAELTLRLDQMDPPLPVRRSYVKDEKWHEITICTVRAGATLDLKCMIKASKKGEIYADLPFDLPWEEKTRIGSEAVERFDVPKADTAKPKAA